MGISLVKFKELNVNGPRPLIFQSSKNDILDREISLRIAAIRETFEEMGILICKTRDQFLQNNKLLTNSFNQVDVSKWQSIVHDNPSKFIELCREYNVAPDLWSLHEWSAWLTPATFNKRFETAFFIVALENLPAVIPEKTEVTDYMLNTPISFLKMFKNKEIILAPPQIYELSRLCEFSNMDKLIEFAKKRASNGLTCIWPNVFQTKDGILHIYPGDDLYPENPNFIDQEDFKKYMDKSFDELLINASNIHRMDMEKLELHINIEPLNGHVQIESLKHENKS